MREMITSTSASRRGLLSYLSLFTSFGTLLCCALPSLLVLLGLGATVASFLSAVPWLVTLSHHKNWVFGVSGALIAGNFVYTYVLAPRLLVRGMGCATDGPDACVRASRTSRVVLWISAVLYCCGAFTAYLLGPILMRSVYGN
jgi:mercuric ion transport protein